MAVSIASFVAVLGLCACDTETLGPPPVAASDSTLVSSDTTGLSGLPAGEGLTNVALVPLVAANPAGRSVRLLPNNTVLAGDNLLVTQPARRGISSDSIITNLGDLPTTLDPFGPQEAWRFRSVSDMAGVVSVVTASPTPQTVCVAATRTVSGSVMAGDKTAGSTVMTLRNCIHGTEDRALAPILLGPVT